ncbi:MAG: hypothetical protein AAFN07_07230, partial [Pseudomonadota bacterium]
ATAIDGEDNVYVANFNEGSVIKITPNGEQEFIAKLDAPDGFAIGHLDFIKGVLFGTAIADQKILMIRKNGKIQVRNQRLNEGRFPNGLTLDPLNNEILFTYGFGPVAEIERIPLRN